MSDRIHNTGPVNSARGLDQTNALGIAGLVVPGKPAEEAALFGLAVGTFERSRSLTPTFAAFGKSFGVEGLKSTLPGALCSAYEASNGSKLVYALGSTNHLSPEERRATDKLAKSVIGDWEIQNTTAVVERFGGSDAVRRLLNQVARVGYSVADSARSA